jgi:1-acyl-sn-glycerol-3-phosphate acyltransferase
LVNGLFALTTHRTVQGREHVPPEGTACLLVFNHLSNLDPPLIFGQLSRFDLTALVAAEYRGSGFHRRMIEWAGGRWIQRGASDRFALKLALDALDRGWIVGIAPEGGRSKTSGMRAAKPGPAFLAVHAGASILPVAVTGTQTISQNLKRLRRAGVTVTFGPVFSLPVETPGDRKGHFQRCSDEIMCQIGALLPLEYRGVYASHPRLLELISEHSAPAIPFEAGDRQGVDDVPARQSRHRVA